MKKIDIVYTDPMARNHMKAATTGSAALDVIACIELPVSIEYGRVTYVDLGFAMHIEDPSICAMLLPRSGLASKRGIVLANTVGLIDSDYTGNVVAGLTLRAKSDHEVIKAGDRVAQLLFTTTLNTLIEFNEKETLNDTERGDGGFGSTGVEI